MKYQNQSFLAKDLIRAKQAKNEQLVSNINNKLIDLGKAIIKKEILEMKTKQIFKKLPGFNKTTKK